MSDDERFMRQAIELAALAARRGNEPFGAVLVRDGRVVFTNENQIYTKTDPTFHAEAGHLRRFCEETHITDLRDCTLYSSCERQGFGGRPWGGGLRLQRDSIFPLSFPSPGDSGGFAGGKPLSAAGILLPSRKRVDLFPERPAAGWLSPRILSGLQSPAASFPSKGLPARRRPFQGWLPRIRTEQKPRLRRGFCTDG